MAGETLLQHWIISEFALPFLLIFFIVFAILKKTKLLGDDADQLNALVAFVIGLIFVGAVFPKTVVSNMILFLTVAIVVAFVGLILWGFMAGTELKENIIGGKALKWVAGIVVVVAVVIALLWATGIQSDIIDLLFQQSWSKTLWTNILFVVVIAVALAIALKKKSE